MSIDRVNRKYFLMATSGSYKGKDSDIDIAVHCPVCGDSRRKKNSTRLHLYHKNNLDFVHCFNGDCAAQNKNMYSFLRDFFPGMLSNYKRETFSDNLKAMASGEIDVFKKFEKPSFEITEHDLSPYLTIIEESADALKYLENRGLPYTGKFGQWYFGHQDLKIGEITYPITNSIVIPLYNKSKMYGFYSRNITNKSFYTYMVDANVGYKVFNWFNINKSANVYIYEGIFDAIAGGFENSIALMGAKIPVERLNELKNPVFVLDNDKTGHVNAISYASMGHSVFVQPDDIIEKDMNEIMLSGEHDIDNMIKNNIYTGISAEVRIRSKM